MITHVFLRAMVAPGTRTFMCPPRHRAMLKESPCRQRGLNSEPLGYNGPESVTLATVPARHTIHNIRLTCAGQYFGTLIFELFFLNYKVLCGQY